MAISVAQSRILSGTPPWDFGAAVTVGNTVFLVGAGYATSGIPVTANSVTLGGSSVPGTVALFNAGTTGGVNSASDGGNIAFMCIWMLPNIQAVGQTALSASIDSGNNNIGAAIYEVAGLGSSPMLDKSSTGSGTSGTVDSGPSGAITAAPEFILGGAMIFGGSGAGAPSGFTDLASGDLWAGYQIAPSAGGSYDWQQTPGADPWAAGVATIAADLTPPPNGSGLLMATFP